MWVRDRGRDRECLSVCVCVYVIYVSTRKYAHLCAYVCLSVCLSVCSIDCTDSFKLLDPNAYWNISLGLITVARTPANAT